VFSCLAYLSRILSRSGKFSHAKAWIEIQKEWNENADPVSNFERQWIITSESNIPKITVYKKYKEISLKKGETPLGIGQFGKAFGQIHDDFLERTDTSVTRVWCNIDIADEQQTLD